ncbi:diketogulonate reductase-like aldo/keto reductase [Motilibacter rhizosphaerae]|uniref:Diketogulonate reductase-like aldo/keto reductase n=1 Tax=Motilibacter rhizosphaerae TaxID=598652 RepID=A0A4Q7N7K7_9ACTN|nr:aldo/keto reductase [Motilibacter rhizosphaerae]RZS77924.1 diketogulonate reductase-like aldo/keto reductase [Motilibacter rhizosphaerae]
MTAPTTRTVSLPGGDAVPALGLGTWYLGEDPARRATELAALRSGIESGLTLIDTAEMYGDGAAEELVGEAVAGRRDSVYLVSKVLPSNATRRGTVDACRASLRRLGTGHLDLYLLHWRGRVPLAETVAGFEDLLQAGEIRGWGVSNLDAPDLDELASVAGGSQVQTDQVLYNLARRGLEHDLLPRCRAAGVPLMAYSPVDHGELLRQPAVRQLAAAKGVTPAQLALAWVLRLPDVFAVVKASTPERVAENRAALDLVLSPEELDELDRSFPPPTRKVPLEMR